MVRQLLLCLGMLGCSGSTDASEGPEEGTDGTPAPQEEVRLQEVASGLERPVYLTAPAGDPRLFIVEQPGRIRVMENGQLLATPFLDIVSRVGSRGNEQGLLGLAFHPEYASNGYLYVNYTDTGGDTRIERYRVSGDRNRADAGSAKTILTIDQPAGNHNGGHLLFGPDGMLYIPTGDGGSGGDPWDNAENRNVLLGKMLRIDVDGGDPYSIPADNPYATRAGARGEIWAIGLRNPWRVAFDRETGLLYVADVGQNQWEEVSVVEAGRAGLHYGWDTLEGSHCFEPGSGCERAGTVLPVVEYPHAEGISITGGYVYRGSRIPALRGHYFYADFGRGWIRSFRYQDGRATEAREWELGDIGNVSSFGEDASRELYVLSLGGKVYRFEPAS